MRRGRRWCSRRCARDASSSTNRLLVASEACGRSPTHAPVTVTSSSAAAPRGQAREVPGYPPRARALGWAVPQPCGERGQHIAGGIRARRPRFEAASALRRPQGPAHEDLHGITDEPFHLGLPGPPPEAEMERLVRDAVEVFLRGALRPPEG